MKSDNCATSVIHLVLLLLLLLIYVTLYILLLLFYVCDRKIFTHQDILSGNGIKFNINMKTIPIASMHLLKKTWFLTSSSCWEGRIGAGGTEKPGLPLEY